MMFRAKPLSPEFIIGFLGGGQLARMSAQQAYRLGMQTAVFGSSKDREPLDWLTPHSRKGSFSDAAALLDFMEICDVVTLENEFIDSRILRDISRDSNTPLFPAHDTFDRIETKLKEKKTFEQAGIEVTPYALIEGEDDLVDFSSSHGYPFLLKSSKGGYDGYGNVTVQDAGQAKQAFEKLGGNEGHEIIAEAFVPFRMELAVQVARNSTGSEVYPCCETIQENHICKAVVAPARIDPVLQRRAMEIAVAATEVIDGRGIFAFEFFLTGDDRLLLNESAPRPHNSGHYTIEACTGSQFENHIRAVLDLPLSDTAMQTPAAVMINLLGTHNRPATPENYLPLMQCRRGYLHLYGKSLSKKGRKMGHFTLLGENQSELLETAVKLAQNFRI